MTTTLLLLCCIILAVNWFKIALSSNIPDGHSVHPTNAVVLQGNRSELRCPPNRTSDVQSWVFQAAGTSKEDPVIYSSGVGANNKMASYFVRKLSDGSVDLIINATQLSHAGLYTCIIRVNVSEEGAVAIVQQTSELIVLDGEPQCSTNITDAISDEDVIEMRCSIGFRGNWAPVMTWKKLNAEGGATISDGVDTVTHANANVTSTLKFLKGPAMNSTRLIVCITHFTSHAGEKESMATNLPDYKYTWFSPLHTAVDEQEISTHWPLTPPILVVCSMGLIIAAFIATAVIIVQKSIQAARTCKPSSSTVKVQSTELYETLKVTGAPKFVPNQYTAVIGKAHEQELIYEDVHIVQSSMTTHQHLYSCLTVTVATKGYDANTIEENVNILNQSSPVYEEIKA